MQDEECVRPGEATDETFLAKMSNNIGRHAHFMSHEAADKISRKTIGRTVSSLMYLLNNFHKMYPEQTSQFL